MIVIHCLEPEERPGLVPEADVPVLAPVNDLSPSSRCLLAPASLHISILGSSQSHRKECFPTRRGYTGSVCLTLYADRELRHKQLKYLSNKMKIESS